MDKLDEENKLVNLPQNERSLARRGIIERVGELIREHPEKFLVKEFVVDAVRAELLIETVLSYQDGDMTLSISARKANKGTEREVRLLDHRGALRIVVYRLDVTRGHQQLYERARSGMEKDGEFKDFYSEFLSDWQTNEDHPLGLVDMYAETKIPLESALELLNDFDEMSVPSDTLGPYRFLTLQQLIEFFKTSRNNEDQDVPLLQ